MPNKSSVRRVVLGTGKVIFARSEEKKQNCICCKGAHIYTRYIRVPKRPRKGTHGLHIESVYDLINEFLQIADDIEGKKIRLIAELLPEDGKK